ncbi:hypothetical protein [Streptomyces fulvorobeus]|uniref:Uncharacterized protein n=1 Tax=Streptomyces fulvorobeus TaxID=284028 RepID=A0A7J0CC63_9ACTN|nr:hypothetical protein [Streptomyces fulvorobeus]NYE43593.1 hypothetical protein [Streptomyces fulvorobeus]GFN00073.1 hypothetical protein Sfulv_48830 [Streptomyces fulvorobeus]
MTKASLGVAAGKAAVIAPLAVTASYVDAWCVRASTGELGWFFGVEFWVMALIVAGVYIRIWTHDDEPWVGGFALLALVAGLVAGPLLLFHGGLAALAGGLGVFVFGAPAPAAARACGFDVGRREVEGREMEGG